jgi:hypothetical protein
VVTILFPARRSFRRLIAQDAVFITGGDDIEQHSLAEIVIGEDDICVDLLLFQRITGNFIEPPGENPGMPVVSSVSAAIPHLASHPV